MKKLIYNKDNLTLEEIEEVVTRVKVFIHNSNNEILLASSFGGCQLPGGHVEDGEKIIDALVREIKEETGIELTAENISDAFFEINHMTRNHKVTGKKRLSRVIYFHVKTDKLPNFDNISLTESEKQGGFKVYYVPQKHFHCHVTNIQETTKISRNKTIATEILEAFEEFKHLFENFN